MSTTSARLLALLSVLQGRRDWSGAELSDRLDVSTRTVRRDVDRLRELGYRIETTKGPAGGYRLDAGAALPPLLFDDEQAVALAISLQLGTTSGAGIVAPALLALTTLRQVLPSRLRHRVETVALAGIAAPTATPDVDPDVLLALSAVTRAREVVRFDYGTTDGPPRRAEPHHVVTWGGRWYLVGYDLDRDDWRTFRVDRLALRTPNGPRFTPRPLPGGDVATFVTGRFRGNDGSAQWPCRGEAIVGLPLDDVRPYVRDGLAEPVDEVRTRVSLGAWSWAGLATALLAFDAEVEIIGPDELVAAMRRTSERAAAAAGARGAP